MATLNLQLLECPKEDILPCGRMAYVALKSHSHVTLRCKSGGETEFSVISPACFTLNDIECEVGKLTQELKEIRKQAKVFSEIINKADNGRKKSYEEK